MSKNEIIQLQKIKSKLTPVERITLDRIIARRNKAIGTIAILGIWAGCVALIITTVMLML